MSATLGHEGRESTGKGPQIHFDTSGLSRVCGGDDEGNGPEAAAAEAAEGGGPEAEAAEAAEEGGPEAEAAGAGGASEDGSSWLHSVQGDMNGHNGPHMWSVWPPRSIRPPPGATEDVWDFNGDTGRLIRHHITVRDRTFGNQPEDWIGCPVDKDNVNGIRRTTLHAGFGSQVLIDDWRDWYAMGAQVQQQPWTGHTEFVVLGAEDSEERADEDADGEEPEDEEPEQEEEEEGQESEEDLFEVSTHTPPSDERMSFSRSRSRSRGRGEGGADRRVGYMRRTQRVWRA